MDFKPEKPEAFHEFAFPFEQNQYNHVKSYRIFLTGGSSGIGAAIANHLTHRGHRVFMTARNENSLREVAQKCPPEFIRFQAADVTMPNQLVGAVDSMMGHWGGIDVCIPNAGLGIFSPLQEAELSHWKTMVDINITGVLNTLHATLPELIKNRGHVIQIGSIAARNVFPNSGVYCATKHAVLALSESLRMEFREALAVTTINPGAVNTEFINQTENAALRESYRPQFEEGMSPEFIAEAIAMAMEAEGKGVFSEITVRPDRR